MTNSQIFTYNISVGLGEVKEQVQYGTETEPEGPLQPQKLDMISWLQKVASGDSVMVFIKQWKYFSKVS